MERKIEKAKTKTEQAEIMGIKIPTTGYWGDYSSKTCGGVGGAYVSNCTKDDVEISEGKKFDTKVKRLE
jgi:hypothetical protein